MMLKEQHLVSGKKFELYYKIQLPQPTGSYNVGVSTHFLKDRSRHHHNAEICLTQTGHKVLLASDSVLSGPFYFAKATKNTSGSANYDGQANTFDTRAHKYMSLIISVIRFPSSSLHLSMPFGLASYGGHVACKLCRTRWLNHHMSSYVLA